MISKKNAVVMPCGTLIPKFTENTVRKKYTSPVTFYQSGAVKRVSLEEQTIIDTPIGRYPAESVVFYESGAIKRFFPLNGKISGYWTEEDEASLCEVLKFCLPAGTFRAKIVSCSFYESGSLKSLTLWPNEQIRLNVAGTVYPVRIGFSLYEDGRIKSLEPGLEIPVETPIGQVVAYDDSAWGIHADTNSLCFDEKGNVIALTSSAHVIKALPFCGSAETIAPALTPHPLIDDCMIKLPIKFYFEDDHVIFVSGGSEKRFRLSITEFKLVSSDDYS